MTRCDACDRDLGDTDPIVVEYGPGVIHTFGTETCREEFEDYHDIEPQSECRVCGEWSPDEEMEQTTVVIDGLKVKADHHPDCDIDAYTEAS